MAKITTTVKVWVDDDTREVFTEKEIAEIKKNKIEDYHADRVELYGIFDDWCNDEDIYFSDFFFASEEKRADYLAQFDRYLEDCADDFIKDGYTLREIEVDIEINAD